MKINIEERSLDFFLKDIKCKLTGKIVNKTVSYDDMAWQYEISDEFERMFVKYSEKDIKNNNFLKVGCFTLNNNVYIELFDKKNILIKIEIMCEVNNDYSLLIKDIKIQK